MREILLVEDTDTDAQAVTEALKRAGIANPVRRFFNGVEAMAHLNYIEEAAAIGPPPPSVLLLDLKLPGFSGFELLQRIRGRPVFAKTLRVVLSQLDDTHSIKRAYGLGADSFLIKPVTQSELRELVEMFPGYWSFVHRRVPANPQLGGAVSS